MNSWRQALIIGALTFFLSLMFNLGSNSLLAVLPFLLSIVLLIVIIFVGILFDIIGVAAAAGEETPFHAMASNRISGARQGIWLLRNADTVATFCSDVVGDIAGTLSGAIGAALVFRLLLIEPSFNETVLTTLVVSLVAASTVGGKALGKNVAIHRSTEIIYVVARILASLERIGLKIIPEGKNRKKR